MKNSVTTHDENKITTDRQSGENSGAAARSSTAAFNHLTDAAKRFFRNNRLTSGFYEFLFYVKRDGYKNTIEYYKNKKTGFKTIEAAVNEVIDINEIEPVKKLNRKTAVHLHLDNTEFLDEFISYFSNIPFPFDIYVSCKTGCNLKDIETKLESAENVRKIRVEEVPDRGRDIAPLYVLFGQELKNYDYFLHVHSLKTYCSGGEQYDLRRSGLDCLLKDRNTVGKIFALFESYDNAGILYPEISDDMPMTALSWLNNAEEGRHLLESMGIESEDGFFNYPVGSFFWARTEAVIPLFEKGFTSESFPEEKGQTDGTLVQVLERAVSFVSRSRGFQDAIFDADNCKISLGKSFKAFQDYFTTTAESAVTYLKQYDVVSFDIFDTLITRCIYEPDDIFRIMSYIIKKEYGTDCNFTELRKRAEARAWEKKKEYTSVSDIYDELVSVMNISPEISEQLKNLEAELEITFCVPRRDVLYIFNQLKEAGVRIILVSDMYLTSDIVEKMLKKCGYEGYSELWLSCEKGVRKDNNTLWKEYCSQLGSVKSVHVGDNPCSDIQAVSELGKDSFFVINPRSAFKMSRYYRYIRKFSDDSITSSLLLGMFINNGIYNSPFCQGADGEPSADDYSTLGYCCFGPLFTVFCKWINTVTDKDDTLFFLAREGYIFEKFYNRLYSKNENEKRKTEYLLASRRAVSVAAIRSEEDIRSILEQHYNGSFSNLLKERLGTDMYDDLSEKTLSMPEDLNEVMAALRPHFDDIFAAAKKERHNYTEYLDRSGFTNGGVLTDVGYSGTMQYYFAKLLGTKPYGIYLCTSLNRKPEKLGCICRSLYKITDASDENTNKIFTNQLFLEAALKAPYGQLICFENQEGRIQPLYKDDKLISNELRLIQEGILKFADDFASFTEKFADAVEIKTELAAELFGLCIESGWITEKVGSVMEVQDDYCENGSHRFNAKTSTWDIIKTQA